MTDDTSQPSFKGLIEAANQLLDTGVTATPEEAEELKAIVNRLLAPFQALIDAANQLFDTGVTATPEEAAQLKAIVDRLLAPDRGATLDFSDPANSGLIGSL
jgi:hypothetical protein